MVGIIYIFAILFVYAWLAISIWERYVCDATKLRSEKELDRLMDEIRKSAIAISYPPSIIRNCEITGKIGIIEFNSGWTTIWNK